MAQFARKIGRCRIALEEVVDRFLRERVAPALLPAEEVRAAIGGAYGEVRAEKLSAPNVERMPMRVTAFEPCDEHLITLEVAQLQQCRLAPPKAMPVHEIEQKEVADVLRWNCLEEPLGLFLRVVLDWPLLAWAACSYPASPATRTRPLSFGMNGDFAGNPGFH